MTRDWRSIFLKIFPFCLLFFLQWLLIHVTYDPLSRRWMFSEPQALRGDEPHYLLLVNSLLFDHDLDLKDDYLSVSRGGLEAGRKYQGVFLIHHTVLFDPTTRERGGWRSVFDTSKKVPCEAHDELCQGFQRKSPRFLDMQKVKEFSQHHPGFPVMALAFLSPTRPSLEQVEKRVFYFVFLCAGLTTLLLYRLAREIGLRPVFAWSSAILLSLCSSWLLYARSYWSETTAGLILLLGLWGLYKNRPVLAALAVGAAVSLKPVFVLVGVGWFIERLWARRGRSALVLGLTLGACFIILEAIYYWRMGFVYYWGGVAASSGSRGLPNPIPSLLDLRYGLFLFVPWTVVSFYALGRSLIKFRTDRDEILRMIAVPVFLFLLFVSTLPFLGGSCYGPRYWVPFLPWLALAAAPFLAEGGKWTRTATAALAAVALLFSVSASFVYPWVWDKKPSAALEMIFTGSPRP